MSLFAIGPSEPGPALRRGALVAIPVGLAMLLEFGLDSPTKSAIGEPALRAAGQRAVATAIGIAIAGAAFLLWPNPGEGAPRRAGRRRVAPTASPRA